VDIIMRHVEKEYKALTDEQLQDAARKYHLNPDTGSRESLIASIMEHLRSSSHDDGSSGAAGDDANGEGDGDGEHEQAPVPASADLDATEGSVEIGQEGDASEELGGEGAEEGADGMGGEMLYLDGNASAALEQLGRARRLQGRCLQTPFATHLSTLDLLLHPMPSSAQPPRSAWWIWQGQGAGEEVESEMMRMLRARDSQDALGQTRRLLPAPPPVNSGTIVLQQDGQSVNVKVELGAGGSGNIWDALGRPPLSLVAIAPPVLSGLVVSRV
jgi:hypothetical protein